MNNYHKAGMAFYILIEILLGSRYSTELVLPKSMTVIFTPGALDVVLVLLLYTSLLVMKADIQHVASCETNPFVFNFEERNNETMTWQNCSFNTS